jgi:hypothetical protein
VRKAEIRADDKAFKQERAAEARLRERDPSPIEALLDRPEDTEDP